MTRLVFLLATTLVTLFCAGAALAKKEKAEVAIQLEAAPVTLSADAAYILVKASVAKSGLFAIQHVLLREPSAQEIADYRAAKKAAYDTELPKLTKKAKGGPVPTIDQFQFDYTGKPNSFVIKVGKFLEDGEMRTILLQVPPGRYILYGVTVGDRMVASCNCLGTVSFEAQAGVITHLGSLYADKVHKKSPLPHLEDDLGEQMFEYSFVLGGALVPADEQTAMPASLSNLPMKTANLEIVEQFYEPGATNINRLAPIPGILGYERGRPVDLRKK
jgi:hypothetical protein